MKQLYLDFIYLISCSINEYSIDTKRIKKININELYELSKNHQVVVIVNKALEEANIFNNNFKQASDKALRKKILFNVERESILKDFEENKIWNVPLKGCELEKYYPHFSMRQMGDNDIFFDAKKRDQARSIMENHKYEVVHFNENNHDIYHKDPALNFELHTELFDRTMYLEYCEYYKNIESKLLKDDNKKYGYHFSDEDFYIFITLHECKHYYLSGVGIRSLVDCYLFLKEKKDRLNWKYVKEELNKLGILDFEKQRRKLSNKLFSKYKISKLTDDEIEMLNHYMTSGASGTFENFINIQLKNESKLTFWIKNIFVPMEKMNRSVPFTAKSKLLYPVGVVWRCLRMIIRNNKYILNTMKVVRKYDK